MLSGNGYNREVDWWCLGCMLYALLHAGRHPYQHKDSVEEQYYEAIKQKLILSHVSQEMEQLLTQVRRDLDCYYILQLF